MNIIQQKTFAVTSLRNRETAVPVSGAILIQAGELCMGNEKSGSEISVSGPLFLWFMMTGKVQQVLLPSSAVSELRNYFE